jgi:hypothetical protein
MYDASIRKVDGERVCCQSDIVHRGPGHYEIRCHSVLAMACVVGIDNAFGIGRAEAIACGRNMFDVMIVASLLLISVGSKAISFL